MALGSDGRRIIGLIVTEGVSGCSRSAWPGSGSRRGRSAIRRAMEAQLFGVQPMDPLVLAARDQNAGSSARSPRPPFRQPARRQRDEESDPASSPSTINRGVGGSRYCPYAGCTLAPLTVFLDAEAAASDDLRTGGRVSDASRSTASGVAARDAEGRRPARPAASSTTARSSAARRTRAAGGCSSISSSRTPASRSRRAPAAALAELHTYHTASNLWECVPDARAAGDQSAPRGEACASSSCRTPTAHCGRTLDRLGS